MKVHIILLILLFSFRANSTQVAKTGEVISQNIMNSSLLQVGDIKQSILPLVQFQALSGDCWKLMDGASIQGSELAIISGKTTTPDARGSFLRMQNNGRNDGKQNPEEKDLGEFQSDAFQGHHHGVGFSGYYGRLTNSPPWVGWDYTGAEGHVNSLANSPYSAGTKPAGGFGTPRIANETRAKNITVNFYIKINKECNFN